MTFDEIASATIHLAPKQQARLLARVSFELTIAARSTYIPGSDGVAAPEQLRAFNEIQHRVSSCLLELLEGRTVGAWVWPTIKEFSEMAECYEEVALACSRAFLQVASADAL